MHFSPALLLLALFSSALFSFAQDTPIIVTNNTNADEGSLRAALALVAQDGTITFDAEMDGETIVLVGDALSLTKNVSIDASSLENGITIDGDSDDTSQGRIFIVSSGSTSNFLNITFINGGTPDGEEGGPFFLDGDGDNANSGGAIYNSGNLTLTRCFFSDNFTGAGGNGSTGRGGSGGAGGAIYNTGQLTLIECTFQDNSTGAGGNGAGGDVGGAFGSRAGEGGAGGAIANSSGGTLIANGCTLNGNQTGDGGLGGNGVGLGGNGGRGGHGGNGGAISNRGEIILTNCTITANLTGSGGLGGDSTINFAGTGGSSGSGGAIYQTGNAFTMVHCTVTENSIGEAGEGGMRIPGEDQETSAGDEGSLGNGGGIFSTGNLSLTNSIVSANDKEKAEEIRADDLVGQVDDPTNNILDSEISIQLNALGNFGGPTSTMPPLSTSPAVDAGSLNEAGALDQRGLFRSGHGVLILNATSDLGAVELQGTEGEKYDVLFETDTDGDGLSDGDELILGTDPFVSDYFGTDNLSITSIDPATKAPTFSFAYHDPDIQLQITRSTDLITFTPIAESSADFQATADGLVQFTDDDPPAEGKVFYRIEAPRPE